MINYPKEMVEKIVANYNLTDEFQDAVNYGLDFHLMVIHPELEYPLEIETTYQGDVALFHSFTEKGVKKFDPKVVFDPSNNWSVFQYIVDVPYYRLESFRGEVAPHLEQRGIDWISKLSSFGFSEPGLKAKSNTHKIT